MKKTVDGFEMTFQVNVLAGFLLTTLLMDTVAKAEEPRIIITSSISQGIAVAYMCHPGPVTAMMPGSSIDFENLNMEKVFSSHG